METESNKLKDENEFLEKELQQKVLHIKRMERELEIEASLERVRTRSMAMNRSEELLEIAELIYHEVIGLNVHTNGVGFCLLNTKNTEGQWFAYNGFSLFKRPVKVNMGKDKYLLKAYLSWKNGEDRMVNDLEGEELQMHNQNLMSLLPLSEELIRDEALKKAMEQAVDTRDRHLVYHFNFVDGVVFFSNGSPIEEVEVLGRFFKVFEQTYTRFLDLKKAEAQAREAQIEAALERIRAASMAMHKSEELPNVALTLLAQIEKLALPVLGVAIPEVDAEKDTVIVYFADNTKEEGTQELTSTREFEASSFWQAEESIKRIRSGEKEFTIIAEAERIQLWIDFVDEWISKERASRLRAANFSKVYFHFIQYHGLSPITVSSLGPLTEEHQSLIRRLVATFAMSYRRYLDLKKAEAQAREAQIEAALERIRAASMAMHKSEELTNVALTLLAQIEKLVLPVLGVAISEVDAEKETAIIYFADNTKEGTQELTSSGEFQISSYWQSDESYKLSKSGEKEFTLIAEAERLQSWIDFVDEWISKERASRLRAANLSKVYFHYVIHHELSAITISTLVPLTEENQLLIRRLVATFAMSYRRYLDLKKAEAQAREAQIEAALERIRAASMSMHKSEELPNVALTLLAQIENLALPVLGVAISEVDAEKETAILYFADNTKEEGTHELISTREFEISSFWQTDESFKRVRSGEKEFTIIAEAERLQLWIDFVDKWISKERASRLRAANLSKVYFHYMIHHELSAIVISSLRPLTEEHQSLIRRLVATFAMSYRRYLDLKKAEAQAREAQIEASLERIRASTMAMHHSQELLDTAKILFLQFEELGIELDVCGFSIMEKDSPAGRQFLSIGGTLFPEPLPVSYDTDPQLIRAYSAWKEGQSELIVDIQGEELKQHLAHNLDFLKKSKAFDLLSNTAAKFNTNEVQVPSRLVVQHAYFKDGYLFVTSRRPIENSEILLRFAKVFEQTYTRFLDLQKAEAQAREAQIEAALERVRSRALAMHSSEELPEVLDVVFTQMQALDFSSFHTVLGILNSEKNIFETWSKGVGAYSFPSRFLIPITDHPHFKIFLKGFEDGVAFHSFISSGKTLRSWDDYLFSLPEMKHIPEEVKKNYYEVKEAHFSMAYMKSAILFADGQEPLSPDQISTLKRFASVLDLTLTRMQDLQKAELQAREAIKQASLDRVRAEIASMRSTEDLQRITPLIWHELTVLGVPFFRCGVFIIDEAQEIVHSYLSTPEGHSLAVMELPFDVNEMTTQVVTHWKQNRVFKEHWNKEQFVSWMQSMVEQHRLQNPTVYQASPTPPESLFLHFIPFKQGMLYVGSTEVLSGDEIELIQTLAAAFSIAYARYEDFKQLEEAKTKVEATLDELKSTQAQLIQSEKMASLGELTAGIAHEIQNPLNFVNNYSEVNVELLEELNKEYEKGNPIEVKAIIQDLTDNETKIYHHGKRADAIVRGMLQHSRTSSGTKEPTDLNALADEYLRLAYHGLRAKDSSFQADYSTDFDENLPLIKVVPQDIGRVLLNVINNAFQACHERCCAQIHPDYAPKVTISTQNRGEFIEIRIQDNGGGIPEAIKDKIFQPFFTTKPTGQGTGLGLSLAYDSVKAHGGELSVESNEGEGTTFILSLPL